MGMVRVMKLALVLLIVAGVAGVVVPVYSQEKTEQQIAASVPGGSSFSGSGEI